MADSPAGQPSFDEIYRRFAPSVVGYLRARGVDDPEAVSQDVFLAILPTIDRTSGGEAGVRTLLFTIAHARAVDHHRNRARHAPTVAYSAELDERTTASAEEVVVTRASHHAAIAVLSTLPDSYREVLLLRVVAELPLHDVAAVMGKTLGSVKQLQRRAILALKDHPDIVEGKIR